jgi:membrane protease YdiL (CAAX protease family)
MGQQILVQKQVPVSGLMIKISSFSSQSSGHRGKFLHVYAAVQLPTCLSLAFVAQRTKNTWPGIIIHFVSNGIVLISIVLGILGWHS